MGNSVEPLPEGLWSQIAVRLPGRQDDEEPPPMPRLTPEAASRPSGRRHRMAAPRGVAATAADNGRRSRGRRGRCGGRLGHRPGAGRRQGLEPAVGPGGTDGRRGGRAQHAGAPGGHTGLEHAYGAGEDGGPPFRAGVHVLVDPAGASTRAGPTSSGPLRGTSRSPSGCWAARRARPPSPWRDRPALAPEHHGRTGGRVGLPDRARSSPPGLSDDGARSC